MKRIVSLAMACILLLAGCAGPQGGPGRKSLSRLALAEPVYPDFPQKPQLPEEFGEKEWDDYSQAYDKYMDALWALRGDDSGLTQAQWKMLNTFAAKSAPLVLTEGTAENAIYSPLSLWSALAMLAQCAGNGSRQQVLQAVGADSVEALQEEVSQIWRNLYTDDGLSALILANSIWLNSDMEGSYVQETLNALAEKYYAGAYAVPMGESAADQAVTQWVKEQTNGLIGGEQPVVRTEHETLALLVSSLYYKAAWEDEFSADRTQEEIFTNAAGQESRADFMHKTQDANFIRRDGYQAARLATDLGEMVFVLPDEGTAPESLLQEPDFLSRLEFYGDAAIWGEVRWSVPKFDVNSDLDLKQALSALGITELLDPDRADLSALTDLDAFLSEARQLSRVKVDEEGVEAAAVTILGLSYAGMPPEDPEICIMDLNRPFLFVIRTLDVPLFIGIVNQV